MERNSDTLLSAVAKLTEAFDKLKDSLAAIVRDLEDLLWPDFSRIIRRSRAEKRKFICPRKMGTPTKGYAPRRRQRIHQRRG